MDISGRFLEGCDAVSMVEAVSAAVSASQAKPGDEAAVALALHYARLIDDAEAVAAALADVVPEGDHEAGVLWRLKAKVDAHTVASDLGPKLLAALTALGLTPVARSSVKGGEVVDAGADPLAQLRAKRAARSG